MKKHFYRNPGILEKDILLRYLRSSFVIILLYGISDFFNHEKDAFQKAVFAFILYGGCFMFIKYTNGSNLSKRVSVAIFMLSIVSGFFFQGGFLGINSLDHSALVVVVGMVFSGKERRIFMTLCFLQIAALASIQIFHPEWIVNDRVTDTIGVDCLEVIARIGCLFYIGHLYKSGYEQERALLLEATEWLEASNVEVSRQNEVIASANNQLELTMSRLKEEQAQVLESNKKLEEANAKILAHDDYITGYNNQLKVLVTELENEREEVLKVNKKLEEANIEISSQSETIARYNTRLEAMVEERTKDILELNKKLIEYSFVNSHNIRGPLARILGLIVLMKMDSGNNEICYSEYLSRLETSAKEMDEVVRGVTRLLTIQDFEN